MTRCLVHIGLPKTGTTTLQTHLFAGHSQIKGYVQPNWKKDAQTHALLRTLLGDARLQPEDIRQTFAGDLESHRAVVISDEALTFGEFMQRKGSIPGLTTDHYAMAQHLWRVLGPVDIAVFIRNQADFLVSYHRQAMKRGFEPRRPLPDFIADYDRRFDGRLLRALDYDALYDSYAEVFGAERVHLYVYEQWKDRFGDAAASIARLLGVDEEEARDGIEGKRANVTKTTLTELRSVPRLLQPALAEANKLRRRYGRYLPRPLRRLSRQMLTREVALPEVPSEVRDEIRARFAASNRKLFEKLGLSGERLGYW